MQRAPSKTSSGLPMALGAYTIWGLLPLYLKLVHQVPPFEFVGWRIVFTLPLCLAFIAARGQRGELAAAFRDRAVMLKLMLSAVLIGINWLIYIAAIQAGHIFAASLGYYINPLANVVAGTVFLGERLSTRQWLAVGIAALGVSLLAWDAREMLWISLSLAGSFCAYGIVRKLTPVGAVPGLTVETVLLFLPAAALVTWYAAQPAGSAFGRDVTSSLLVAFSGVVTAVPLALFAMAARRMSYSALGFVQFIAPTMVFITGLTVFREPLSQTKLACFVLIWTAIAVFCWDAVQRLRAARPSALGDLPA